MADQERPALPIASNEATRRPSPWRYVIWAAALGLCVANIFTHGFSQDYLRRQMKGGPLEDNRIIAMPSWGDEPITLDWAELQRATYTEQLREEHEGHIGRLRGQFMPGEDEREATLVRFKLICCAADVIPLRVQIVAPAGIAHVDPEQWVEVAGQVQFRKLRGRDELVPVLQVRSPADIVEIEPEARPFLP